MGIPLHISSPGFTDCSIRLAGVGDAAAIAGVQVASWRTTYPGIVAQESIDRLSVEERTAAWERALRGDARFAPAVFVAEHASGEIVGFVSGGAIRDARPGFDAELYAIYLLKDAQGAGVGRALVRRLSQELAEQGHRSMIVWVLANNSACRFYEQLGGRLLEESTHTIDGRDYPDRCYGWNDLSIFA
jgi:L-amino acid N-acyltransferase YncA